MKIVVLLENRAISKEYINKHGLSLYIETKNHKILFDTGPDSSFSKNASNLGVELKDVDIAVISHGHYDHGGGLETFLKLNNKAKVYLGNGAFNRHYLKILGIVNYNIGLKKELTNCERITFIDDIFKIDDELTLFGNIKGDAFIPRGNNNLYKKNNSGIKSKDDFSHEINLLIKEGNNCNLLCGCAHKGIINILSKGESLSNNNLKAVIGGFHLKKNTSIELDELAKILSKRSEVFYTCHCTGEGPYSILKKDMKNLKELKTGMTITI